MSFLKRLYAHSNEEGRAVSHHFARHRVLEALTEFLERMAAAGAIAASELQLLLVTDSIEDAIRHLGRNAIERSGLKAPWALPWLVERKPATTVPSLRS